MTYNVVEAFMRCWYLSHMRAAKTQKNLRISATSPAYTHNLVVLVNAQTKFKSLALSCADPESFVRGVPNLITFFFLFFIDEGIKDPNTAINGPSFARQRNAS